MPMARTISVWTRSEPEIQTVTDMERLKRDSKEHGPGHGTGRAWADLGPLLVDDS